MKIKKLLTLLSSILVASTIGIGLSFIALDDTWQSNDARAFAENVGYNLTLDKTRGDKFKYHYLENSLDIKNYNDEDITFKYKRCYNTPSNYLVMAPKGCFYNPFIKDHPILNGLNGMSSITVNFVTETGKLFLSYGVDNNYNVTGIVLSNNVTYEFISFNPSHFKLSTVVDDINASNNVTIFSISIEYNSDSYYDTDDYEFTSIYSSSNVDVIPSGGSKTYNLGDVNIGSNNYIKITYQSTEPLKGLLNYYGNISSSESFFLEKASGLTEFNTFFDNFRNGSTSASLFTNRHLTTLTITNVGSSEANVNINSIKYANRDYSRNDVFYISDSIIEVGVSLRFAGAISSIKNLNRNIQEYVDTSYNIKIRGSDKHSGDVNNVIRDNPNLISVYDTGRELQQSWYMNVGEEQGYTRGYFDGNYVPYNPVQGGDMNYNESQVIDYKVKYDSLNPAKVKSVWIKTRALDWAKDNELTNSYIESNYSVVDGLLRVTNRFVDFSGWINYENNSGYPEGNYNTNGNDFKNTSEAPLFCTQELPALYTVHPLNYFSTYFTESQGSVNGKLVFDDTIGWNTATTAIDISNNLYQDGSYEGEPTYTSGSNGNTHYEFRKHTENWLGFFNEDKFGIAVYVPANQYNHDQYSERHVYISGMYSRDHSADSKTNRTYLDDYQKAVEASFSRGYTTWWGTTYGKINLTKESCYMFNTGYLSSCLGFYIPNYQAIEYSYAVGADYLNVLRTKFNTIQLSSSIYNDFTAYKGALI